MAMCRSRVHTCPSSTSSRGCSFCLQRFLSANLWDTGQSELTRQHLEVVWMPIRPLVLR